MQRISLPVAVIAVTYLSIYLMFGELSIQIGLALIVGLTVGFVMGVYTAVAYREKDPVFIAQKAVSVVVGTTWLVAHAYLISTGTGSLNIFFDAIGSAAVGDLLGINLVKVLQSVRVTTTAKK